VRIFSVSFLGFLGVVGSSSSVFGLEKISVTKIAHGKSVKYFGTTARTDNSTRTYLQDLKVTAVRHFSSNDLQGGDYLKNLTPAKIKKDVGVIDWDEFDNDFKDSNYAAWAAAMKADGITILQGFSNKFYNWNETPVSSQSEKDKLWMHAFAVVYQMNVRKKLGIDHWVVGNEPNWASEGFYKDETDSVKRRDLYVLYAQVVRDAIQYVYTHYLSGRTARIHGPVTTTASTWPEYFTKNHPELFNVLDFHNYDADHSSVNSVMVKANQTTKYPVWISEWGQFGKLNKTSADASNYNLIDFSIKTILNNMIQDSKNGFEGTILFRIKDNKQSNQNNEWRYNALVSQTDVPRRAYYAFRMGIRALGGARQIYKTTSTKSSLQVMTTQDPKDQSLYVLLTNKDSSSYDFDLDLSAWMAQGTANLWLFDDSINDELQKNAISFSSGRIQSKISGTSAMLFKILPKNITLTLKGNAGADQSIVEGLSVSLNGSAEYNGDLLDLKYQWSKVSGPGSVSFSNSSAALTTATFSKTGTYKLKLSTTAGTLTASDDLVVVVNPVIQPELPVISLRVDKSRITEGDTPSNSANFIISRVSSSASPLTVNFMMSGNAKNGKDYESISSFAIIAAGQTQVSVPLKVLDDETVELDETSTMILQISSTYSLSADSEETVTIEDDDPKDSGGNTDTDSGGDAPTPNPSGNSAGVKPLAAAPAEEGSGTPGCGLVQVEAHQDELPKTTAFVLFGILSIVFGACVFVIRKRKSVYY